MDDLIPINNQLQDIFSAVGYNSINKINLPQIVVVGMQSSGKTSVIEGLVRKDFLPRGSGIVTRCPLVLQLVFVSKDDRKVKRPNGSAEEWARFLHAPDVLYTNFDHVREEIERETTRRCGNNKAICDEPINLKIFSNKVLNLTLVDLPGITKVPIGDQPEDIETQIEKLALQYIENPNTIILAITPANNDFSTSDAIKLARKVDREGRRTLAVLTKLDLVGPESDTLEVLCGHKIAMKLGIIGIINRSQDDINSKKTIDDAIETEKAFLEANYPTIAEQNGTPFLSKTLSRLLMHHIRDCLPELKTRIHSMTARYQSELAKYGEPIKDHPRTLLLLIERFAASYRNTVDGNAQDTITTELIGGARIGYIFKTAFLRNLSTINPLEDLETLDILTALKNSAGPREALFLPDVAFRSLIKKQIRKLLTPSLRCVDLVHEEMQRIIQNCGSEIQQDMLRFPLLQDKITDVVNMLLEQRIQPTKYIIEALLESEMSSINTQHPDFNDTNNIIEHLRESSEPVAGDESRLRIESFVAEGGTSNPPFDASGEMRFDGSSGQTASRRLTAKEQRDCLLIRKLIVSYFNIIRRDTQDKVPKIIMCFLVEHVEKHLQSELTAALYKSEQMAELLGESNLIVKRRQDVVDRLEALQNASKVISVVRETQIM